MAARRSCFLVVLLLLVLILPSNLKLVIASQPLRMMFVCHDGCWEETEYCGRDAFVATGKTDMNHDCIVDGLDLALFYPEFFSGVSGTGLSGDFDNNNFVNVADLAVLAGKLGQTAVPCHSIPIPTQCDGNISISFSSNPSNIVNNATQSPGTYSAYVVVSGVSALRAVEFGVTTSANITDLGITFLSGLTGNVIADFVGFGWRSSALTGTATVARLTYTLTDTNPATISIAMLPAIPWMRNRWTTLGAEVSHEFATINSAGINGPTPGSVASCAASGTITGRVYLETDDDCMFNGSDTPVSGRLVTTTPGAYFGYTDTNGDYAIAVPAGSYEVTLFDFNGSFSTCQDPSLTVNLSAGQSSAGNDFAMATLGATCHDGAWDDGEYCGRDAYTATGDADMNHDCVVDGLDYALFAQEYGLGGMGLSSDLNGDCLVNGQDLALMDASLGHSVSPCNSTPIPVQCDGVLQLSFSTNPSTVITSATQAPGGPYSVWLIVNGVTSAKSIEFWIKASPNVSIGNLTCLGGTSLTQSANYCTNLWGVAVFTPLLTGAATVAKLDYFLTDSSPATITIAPPTPCASWARDRWAPANASVSHEFAFITNVGINGPTPGLTQVCGPLGQITGMVYAEVPTEDCAFNGTDTKLANRVVKAVPGPYYAYTDVNGNYSFSLWPGSYTVSMDGFNSPWKALSPCQSPTYPVTVLANTTSSGNDFALEQDGKITGRVFSDAATPCVFDVGTDVGMAGRQVLAMPGNFVAYTDLNGNYSLNVPVGNYTVTLVQPAVDPWAFPGCFAGSYPVTVAVNATTTGIDFPLNLVGTACNMTTRIVSNGINPGPPPCQNRILRAPCPGVEHEYLVWVWGDPYLSNVTLPSGTTITVQLDAAFTINSVTGDCPITIIGSPNAYTRQVQFNTTIPPGTRCTLTIHATPASAGPYTQVATFNPGVACGGIYARTLSEVSRCNSCDPNDMLVQPGCGASGEVKADEPLTYTTRFQNIGQGPAQNIVIEDVLDGHLDPSSLYIVKASHPVTGVQLEAGNKLVISFENINLPGTTDPDNSHGYVMFSINQDPGLPDGTTISNSASVFFDFNTPVVTNTALTTVKDNPCAVTPVSQPALPKTTFLGQNHPNPFNPTTTIEYGLVSFENVSINIYNARGELVRTLVSGRQAPGWYSVDWDGRDQHGNQVASGVYLSRMQAGAFNQSRKLILLK